MNNSVISENSLLYVFCINSKQLLSRLLLVVALYFVVTGLEIDWNEDEENGTGSPKRVIFGCFTGEGNNKKFGIIDEIIKETAGGAHRYAAEQFNMVKESIIKNIKILKDLKIDSLVLEKNEKYLSITSNY